MTNSPQPKSWRDVLPIHPAAELFPLMSESELRELGEDIKKNGLTSPIVLGHWDKHDPKFKLWDGRNRLDALDAVGLLGYSPPTDDTDTSPQFFIATPAADLPVKVLREGEGHDPYAYVLSANIHRRHLTTEQKRELIAKLIKQTPNTSDRQIAKQTKTSPTTVGKIRKESEATGDVSKLDTRIDTKGRNQPSTKPKRSAEPAAPPKTDPIGSSPVRHSEVPATSVPRLPATVHFLVNNISGQLKEADGKLSTHDRTALFAKIRALVDADDIVDETLRLVEKMTPAQPRDFIARLQKRGLVVGCAQGSAEIPIEQRMAENAALDEAATSPIADDLSIPAFMQRRPS